MARSTNSAVKDDVHICSDSVLSHYVQTGRTKLVQVDVQPFLMQSQLDGGYSSDWFTNNHLNEAVMLMRPVLESCNEAKVDDETKKSEKSKKCVFTGDTVRVACTIKKCQEHNICLVTQFPSHKKQKCHAPSSRAEPHFQERLLHQDKVVAFVCPRMSSSILQLSQLVSADMDARRQHEDISKYFLPS